MPKHDPVEQLKVEDAKVHAAVSEHVQKLARGIIKGADDSGVEPQHTVLACLTAATSILEILHGKAGAAAVLRILLAKTLSDWTAARR